MKRKTKSLVLGAMLALSVTLPINTYGEDFSSSAEAGFTSEDMTTSEEIVGAESDEAAGTVKENGQSEETEENTDLEEAVSTEKPDADVQGFFGTEDEGNPVTFETEENAVFFGDAELLDDGEIAAVGASGTGFDTASTIYTNTMYSTSFTDSVDEIWLKFTVAGDGYISLDFSHEYLESSSTYWRAKIYADGNHEEVASYDFAGNNISYSQQRFGISKGTYYLKLYANYHFDVNFKFKINYTQDGTWETEVNDTYKSADLINVNKQYNGSFQRDGDVDWYTFTVAQDGYMSINFVHNYIERDRPYWQIELYNEQFTKMEYDRITGNTMVFNSEKSGIKAGTYYIKVYSYDYSDMEYGIKINYTSSSVWEKEFNDSYSTANLINLNTTYHGSIQNGRDDVDWYKFTAPAAGEYEIAFGHEYIEKNSCYWRLWIYDSLFKEKGYFDYYGNDQSVSDIITLPDDGTYYIKITDYNESSIPYSLKVVSHVTVKEGWVKSGSNWKYRLSTGEFVTDNWKKIGNNWYHFDADGYMQTGWLKIGSTWYYLKSNGAMAKNEWVDNGRSYVDASGKYVPGKAKYTEGWKKNQKGYWYQNSDGSFPKSQWKKINGEWYHFDANGYMQTGWLKLGSTWYYLKSTGAMAKNEWVVNGKYYVDANGKYVPGKNRYVEGWKKNPKGYWYQNSDGSYPKNQWKKINGEWYHFDANGYMQTGWLKLGSTWYYLKSTGAMAKAEWVDNGKSYVDANGKYVPGKTKYTVGWKKNSKGWWYQNSDGSYPKNQWKYIAGNWYYFNSLGYMQTGWLSYGENLYYLKSNGMMAKNEWVVNGKYYIDINGHLA